MKQPLGLFSILILLTIYSCLDTSARGGEERNESVKSADRTEKLCSPLTFPELESRPDFWRVRTNEIIELCRAVRKGRVVQFAETPAGLPVYAVLYGDFSEKSPQSNWSAASSSSTWKSYYQRSGQCQTVLFCAGIHGAEAESVAAAVNLIQMLESGKDFRGIADDELLNLIRQYRLIIVPCVNMDGRAISPDHLRKISYEKFRMASQGAWPDGRPIQWRESKEYFPLPLDKVAWPGGYPNSEGFNIMHDACPGNIRTAEARGLLQLVERWNVDLMLNGHSCEGTPVLLYPSAFNYPAHVTRGNELVRKVNEAICRAEGRKIPVFGTPKNGNGFNLNTMATLASGALTLTLECSVSCNYPPKKPLDYSFEQMMQPNFVTLKVLLREGLQKPFVDREALFK